MKPSLIVAIAIQLFALHPAHATPLLSLLGKGACAVDPIEENFKNFVREYASKMGAESVYFSDRLTRDGEMVLESFSFVSDQEATYVGSLTIDLRSCKEYISGIGLSIPEALQKND